MFSKLFGQILPMFYDYSNQFLPMLSEIVLYL